MLETDAADIDILEDPPQSDLNQDMATAIYRAIMDELTQGRQGHCLRVSTLRPEIMRDLCARFNSEGVEADVVMLVAPHERIRQPWQITATRLIELRNAQRKPLLVFVPPGLKVAAEDSFGATTFVEVSLEWVSGQVRTELRAELPDDLRRMTDEIITYLEKNEKRINSDDVVRYYVTILRNRPTRQIAGGAIYQFGLIPDFALFDVPDRVKYRLDRNLGALRTVVESNQPLLGRVQELRLKKGTIQSNLYSFLRGQQVRDVRSWASLIAARPQHRLLAFDLWEFDSETQAQERILLVVDTLDLPSRDKAQPTGADNPMYLDVKRATSVSLKWSTKPKPSAVPDLAYFRIEIVSTEGATAWESKNIAAGTAATAQRSKSIKVSEFRDRVEDGLYFFRVRSYSKTDEILNEEDAEKNPEILRDPSNPEGKSKHESEDVWFWVDDSTDAQPPPAEPQRNVVVHSFTEARLRAQFAAVDRKENPVGDKLIPRADRTGWATAKGKRAEAIYNVVYDAQVRFTMPVSNLLRQVESDTLSHPDNLGRWRILFTEGQIHQTAKPTLRQYASSEQAPAPFLQARAAVFAAIQGTGEDSLTSTANLLDAADLIVAYAEAYSDWLGQVQDSFDEYAVHEDSGRRRVASLFLDLDIVEVVLPNDGPLPSRVYLAAPTHPLRLLWHLQWARLADAWVREATTSASPNEALTQQVRQYLLRGLAPVNLPPVIRASHDSGAEALSHFYVEQGSLTPFWGLYVREDVRDSRVLRARLQRALGISRQSAQTEVIGGIGKAALAQKLNRYLVQHPYVFTLKLNVFNPGDAGLIVDAILMVEKERTAKGMPMLRYELRLFTRSTRLDNVGEAVEELLNPERQVSPEADAFTVASQNHLFPKLRFSRNPLDDFQQQPEKYDAHISILHDLFPVDAESQSQGEGRSSFVYGLVQEQVTHFIGDPMYRSHYAWERQLLPMPCLELPGDEYGMSAIISRLLTQIAALQASVVAGKRVDGYVPTLRLNLALNDKNLLYQVHAASDWVFIIDRHLGLEYFDSDMGDDRPVYLLDFTPEFVGHDTDRLLLTTRSVDEVTSLIKPALVENNLLVREGVETFFLQLLRSLSGRLALKLISSPTAVTEALGLAAARLFLEQYGLLEDRIILSLDVHSSLFAEAARDAGSEDESMLRRGDLLLARCDPDTRTLHLHVVEVKWRKGLTGLGAYMDLRGQIESQLTASERALRKHFDPFLRQHDRIDRQVKTRELASILSFYMERARRYGLLSNSALERMRPFIQSLDEGYEIVCRGAGIIFDLDYRGLDHDEEHSGLAFYRVGRDYLRKMVENGLARRDSIRQDTSAIPSAIEEYDQRKRQEEHIARDTSMHGDRSYSGVRSHFGSTTPSGPDMVSTSDLPETVHRSTTTGNGTSGPQSQALEGVVKARASTSASADPVASQVERMPQPSHPPLASSTDVVPQYSKPQHADFGTIEAADTASAGSHSADVTASSAVEAVLAGPAYDVMLGDTAPSAQYGILGKVGNKVVAFDLNGTNTISLFGVQGGGKSYSVGTIIEMATCPLPGINLLPAPLASVVFHYHESQDYPPEFVSMVKPNDNAGEIDALEREYGARPAKLDDVIILTSADKVEARRVEFPSVAVEPIFFASNELSFKDWRFLMGVTGGQMYMKQVNMIMRKLRSTLTLDTLRDEIDDSDLSDQQKTIARIRLDFASQFIDDAARLAEKLKPGRLIVVDLRDEFIDKDEALGLFVVMLNIFANAGRHEGYNKLIVFDEAHKYMDNEDLTGHIVDVIRQMRHQGVSVLIASQDPPSLPNAIIELSSLVILHRFNSPKWLAHVQRSITALGSLTSMQMAALRPGEAYLWANKASEPLFTNQAVKLRMRPRATKHGGGTRTAV
ncbi:MAG: hypothetical protein ABI670_11240 [Chloroflexota bacterium]